MSAKRKTLVSEASKIERVVGLIVSNFRKNHSQLSNCSVEIVYAVKDCDPCGALLFIHICIHVYKQCKKEVLLIKSLW